MKPICIALSLNVGTVSVKKETNKARREEIIQDKIT